MTEMIAETGCPVDIEGVEVTTKEDVVRDRENSLAEQLAEMKKRKRKLVDPIQFEMSIQAEDLSGYVPAFGWEMSPASDKQVKALEKYGIFPDQIENAGKASKLLDVLISARARILRRHVKSASEGKKDFSTSVRGIFKMPTNSLHG